MKGIVEALSLVANATDDLARLGDKVGQADEEGLRAAASAVRDFRDRLATLEEFVEEALRFGAYYSRQRHQSEPGLRFLVKYHALAAARAAKPPS